LKYLIKKKWISHLFLLAVVSLAGIGGAQGADAAPDFSLPSIKGGNVSLADSDGKIRIIDFWATWCPPCLKGIPEFVTLYDEYKDKGVEIIGISLDEGGMAVVKPFAKKMKMNYPVVLGGAEVAEAYGGVRAIPTAFIVNQKGEITKKLVGYHPISVFKKEIQALLK